MKHHDQLSTRWSGVHRTGSVCVGVSAIVFVLIRAGYAEAQVTEKPQKLDDIVVLSNSLDARDVVAPVSILTGVDLLIKKASTLGETVNGLLGVSSTFFGPNASRPTIRGLDGDRVRILNNLGASLDASSLSYDHNPSIDPLVIERIEVLRGPAALLYGGTAIGGVVNIVDNRIPSQAVSGANGAFETRFGGAEKERGTSALLEFGTANKNAASGFSVHADGFKRNTDDYQVPAGTGLHNPIINSAAESKGGALGASYVFANGFVGLAQTNYQSIYGTVAEETVKINMHQNRTAFEANLHDLKGAVSGIFLKASYSDYQHTELDSGVPATVFKNKGNEIRLEAKHAKFGVLQGALQGLIGIQSERFNFSALGDEAFVPHTKTGNDAVFVFEELSIGAGKYAFGARVEHDNVISCGAGGRAARSNSASCNADEGGAARFGEAAQKSFNLASGSFGTQWKINEAYTFIGNLSLAERAPTFYELYADGPHLATAAYEVGNQAQSKERSVSMDLAMLWKSAANTVRVGVFRQQFQRYIALNRSGVKRDADGNGGGVSVVDCGNGTSVESNCTSLVLPEFRFQGVSARFTGFEAEGTWRLVEQPYKLDLNAKIDYVRAEDRTNNQPLPRITPMRFTTSLVRTEGGLSVRGDIEYHAKQDRFPAIDAIGATNGYTMFNAAITYAFSMDAGSGLGSGVSGGVSGGLSGTVFIKATNLTDRLAYSAASVDTIRHLAPYPGRGIKVGVQLRF